MLDYSYTSARLRVSTVALKDQTKVDIVLTSDEKNTISVGFQREEIKSPQIGYKSAVKIMRSVILSIQDVLSTKNKMLEELSQDKITIEISVISSVTPRRLRMYLKLIKRYAPRLEQNEKIPFKHLKTDIINGTIKIFIQRV